MPRYLVKGNPHRGRGRNSVQLAEEIAVAYAPRYKPTGRMGGMEVKPDGHHTDRLNHNVKQGTDGFAGSAGRRRYYRHGFPATAAETKKIIRVLRDQEATGIDSCMKAIATARAELDALEQGLDEQLREAFSRGNIVRLAELVEMADATESQIERGQG